MTQLTPNGQLDPTFGSGGVATISLAPDGNEYVSGATLDPSGRIVAVGSVRFGTVVDRALVGVRHRASRPAALLDPSFGTRVYHHGPGTEAAYYENVPATSLCSVAVALSPADTSGSASLFNSEPVLVAYTDAGSPTSTFGINGVRRAPVSNSATASTALEPRAGGASPAGGRRTLAVTP